MSTLVNVGTVGHVDHGTAHALHEKTTGRRYVIRAADRMPTTAVIVKPAHQQYGPQRSRGKGKRQRSWEK